MIHEYDEHRLRIAFYGFAEREAGSVSSAGYVILQELLERGHQIDFFGKRSFAFPTGLEAYPNFRLINAERLLERWFGQACHFGNGILRKIAGPLTAAQTRRNIPSAIRVEHQKSPYDVCLYFGTWAFDRVATLPTISWIQGPPGTDSRSIARQARQLRRLEGTVRYLLLRLFAGYRETIGRPPFQYSDAVICGSSWAAEDVRPFLASSVSIEALPYPIDLNTFTAMKQRQQTPTVLWAGRSVPRKRLDLFLDACSSLLDAGRVFDIRVVGGFSFAPGYQRLIDTFRYPDRLNYSAVVPRDQMPDLYRQASVLVQPSEDENFGSAVAEALACGTPVVVGPTNGTSDYAGNAGFKFLTYDTSSVASAIATALDACVADPNALTVEARAAAETFFDVRTVVKKLLEQLSAASRRTFRTTTDAPAATSTTQTQLLSN